MAIKLDTTFPGRVDPVSADWPLGEPRDRTAPGNGTPFAMEAYFKDFEALRQAVLTRASITPSDVPDTALNSQYLDGLQALFLGNVKLFGPTGDGVADDSAAFASADSDGKLLYINPPATSYNFSAPLSMNSPALIDPSIPWASLFDGGNLKINKGRITGGGFNANIWRFADRVLIGEAAEKFAGDSTGTDGGTSWFDNVNYPGYLGINSHVLVTGNPGGGGLSAPYGYSAGLRTSDAGQGVICFGAAAVADAAGQTAWGFIVEGQREGSGSVVLSIELAAKNKGDNGICTPNTLVTGGPPGIYGVWGAGGGDNTFGGASTNPSTAMIAVLSNSQTWNSGIVFARDGLTNGEALALSSEGVGGAHALKWYNASDNVNFTIRGSSNDSDAWVLDRGNNGLALLKSGSEIHRFSGAVSGVNGFNFYATPTGASPQFLAIGSDANIDIRLVPKGSGVLQFGTRTAIGAETVTGYITIKDSAGTTRKIAVVS